MTGRVLNITTYIAKLMAVVALSALSLFVYKVALQPAIHEFYQTQPDILLAYGLVLVAALVHAVLLSPLILKLSVGLRRVVSSLMGLTVMGYCIQLAWISPLQHLPFWLVVLLSYVLAWVGVLWFGQWMIKREQIFNRQVHEGGSKESYLFPARKRHS